MGGSSLVQAGQARRLSTFAFAFLFVLLVAGASVRAHADPVFTFTLVGDGHVVQFNDPNPNPIPFYTSVNDFVYLAATTGTVDGVGGYAISGYDEVAGSILQPPFGLNVSPLPSGLTPSPYAPATFTLNIAEGVITTLVSETPTSPLPFGGDEIYTYAWLPGEYTVNGQDLDHTQSTYTLTIVEDQATGVTPELPAWLLVLTGALCLGWKLRRRARLGAFKQPCEIPGSESCFWSSWSCRAVLRT